MTTLQSKLGGTLLIVFSLSLLGIEIGLHIWHELHERVYQVSDTVLLVALVLGFVGMFILSPRRAKEGGRFLVDSTVRIVAVIRSGRRKDDSMMAVVENNQGEQQTLTIPTISSELELPIDVMGDMPLRRKTDAIDPGGPNGKGN